MSIINRKQLAAMYTDKDAKRYARTNQEELRLTNGPGAYLLQIEGVRCGVSKKPGPMQGKTFIGFSFKVVKASSCIANGHEHDATLAPGDTAAHVLVMDREMSSKELLELVSAAQGTSPVYEIEEGKHAGKLLIMLDPDDIDAAVDVEDFRDSNLYDPETKGGVLVSCIVKPREGKGEHAGKTFHNASWFPGLGEQIADRFPSLADLIEADPEAIQAAISAQHD